MKSLSPRGSGAGSVAQPVRLKFADRCGARKSDGEVPLNRALRRTGDHLAEASSSEILPEKQV